MWVVTRHAPLPFFSSGGFGDVSWEKKQHVTKALIHPHPCPHPSPLYPPPCAHLPLPYPLSTLACYTSTPSPFPALSRPSPGPLYPHSHPHPSTPYPFAPLPCYTLPFPFPLALLHPILSLPFPALSLFPGPGSGGMGMGTEETASQAGDGSLEDGGLEAMQMAAYVAGPSAAMMERVEQILAASHEWQFDAFALADATQVGVALSVEGCMPGVVWVFSLRRGCLGVGRPLPPYQ